MTEINDNDDNVNYDRYENDPSVKEELRWINIDKNPTPQFILESRSIESSKLTDLLMEVQAILAEIDPELVDQAIIDDRIDEDDFSQLMFRIPRFETQEEADLRVSKAEQREKALMVRIKEVNEARRASALSYRDYHEREAVRVILKMNPLRRAKLLKELNQEDNKNED